MHPPAPESVHDHWQPTSVEGAPLARNAHSAVWTGREMIVWGGEGELMVDMATFNRPDLGLIMYSGMPLDSGGRYEPQRDIWRPMSSEGAPTARSQHTAIWTGTEMIVWGGVVSTQYLSPAQADDPAYYLPSTGGRYDPVSDTWRPVSTVGAPLGRCGHHALWTGREMIIWAGGGLKGTVDGGRYDPVTDTWTTLRITGHAPLYEPASVVWTGDALLSWGGFDLWGGTSGPRLSKQVRIPGGETLVCATA